MRIFLIGPMILLLNAAPIPADPTALKAPKADQESGDTQRLEKRAISPIVKSPFFTALFPFGLMAKNAQRMPNALPNQIGQYALSNVGLKNVGPSAMRSLLFRPRSRPSYSFKDDPSKDDFSIVKYWAQIKRPKDKDAFKKKMLKNPTLKELFEWKEGLNPSVDNLYNEIQERNLEKVKFLFATGFEPTNRHLLSAKIKGNPDMIKYVSDKIQKDLNDLFFKIEKENSKAGKAGNGWNEAILMRFLSDDIQLNILEHFSFSYDDAKKIASKKGLSIDWAIQKHDPSKDNYALVQEWTGMEDSPAKDAFREKMILNLKLKELFEWKEGLDHLNDNDKCWSIVGEGNLERAKFLIATQVNVDKDPIATAIQQDDLKRVKNLLAEEGTKFI